MTKIASTEPVPGGRALGEESDAAPRRLLLQLGQDDLGAWEEKRDFYAMVWDGDDCAVFVETVRTVKMYVVLVRV